MWFCLSNICQSSGRFEFIKVGIIDTFCFFLKILVFLNYSMSENFKKTCGRPVFREELQAARNFSKVTLDFNKMHNSLRQVLQTYSEIRIFCW